MMKGVGGESRSIWIKRFHSMGVIISRVASDLRTIQSPILHGVQTLNEEVHYNLYRLPGFPVR